MTSASSAAKTIIEFESQYKVVICIDLRLSGHESEYVHQYDQVLNEMHMNNLHSSSILKSFS